MIYYKSIIILGIGSESVFFLRKGWGGSRIYTTQVSLSPVSNQRKFFFNYLFSWLFSLALCRELKILFFSFFNYRGFSLTASSNLVFLLVLFSSTFFANMLLDAVLAKKEDLEPDHEKFGSRSNRLRLYQIRIQGIKSSLF